jgi:hypothetical protein
MSENTELAMPKREIRAGLVSEILGVYRMLIEEHLPVDVVGQINLEQEDLTLHVTPCGPFLSLRTRQRAVNCRPARPQATARGARPAVGG